MKPCISLVTFLSTPFETEIPALARGGWSAVELWLTKLETYLERHTLAEARRLLDEEGIRAVAAASQGGLLSASGAGRDAHWDHFRRRLDLLAELQVPTLIITGDFFAEPQGEDLSRATASLAEATQLAGGRGIRLALEFQKSARFCASLDTALALIAQVDDDRLGVCLDLFHYYTGPSKFEDLAYLTPTNLAWVQICDLSGTPRELARDGDRIFPGDGDFLLGPILDQLAALEYDGYVSMELLNPQLWQIPVDRVAQIGYQAMLRTLDTHAETGPGPEEARR